MPMIVSEKCQVENLITTHTPKNKGDLLRNEWRDAQDELKKSIEPPADDHVREVSR
jgi:hypothetical protein